MFTRLRNKFLLLNLFVTSGVIILAFGFIYFITYSNLQADIRQRLQAQPAAQMRLPSTEDVAGRLGESDVNQSVVRNVMAEDAGTFQVEVDKDGQIIRIESAVNLPEDTYRQLAAIAWNHRGMDHVITLGNRQWRYAVSPIRVQIIGEDGAPLAVAEHNYNILFLDVTVMNETLRQLLMTLLFVGLGTLIVIFAVSLHVASQAIRPIREAWEKQKQFVADASHELKTPLSIIQANCDALVASREDTIQNQMKWIEYIRGGADRMTKLVHDLLILAKIDDESMVPRHGPFNLSEVIESASRSMEAAAMRKNLIVTHLIEPGLSANGDPDGIRQVVEILLDNAIKYANPGGWVTLSLTRAGRRITFTIANSGPGIAKEDLPKVFDRFFRADRSRTHTNGSYGLGLSIAQSIMKRHGSEIRVHSEENVATTFSFTLAAGRPHAAQIAPRRHRGGAKT
ncbi:MAG: histidine kinase [Anaerolineae bacterium]|nr:MAG: histidine kinase [Anaerolineae bacterium]